MVSRGHKHISMSKHCAIFASVTALCRRFRGSGNFFNPFFFFFFIFYNYFRTVLVCVGFVVEAHPIFRF
jgi:hypothetical protein